MPPPGGLSSDSCPPRASRRSARPAKPGTLARHRASHAVVHDRDGNTARVPRWSSIETRDAAACLATLASASEQTKKSAASAGSSSLSTLPRDLDWDGRPLAEQCERRHEAAVGQQPPGGHPARTRAARGAPRRARFGATRSRSHRRPRHRSVPLRGVLATLSSRLSAPSRSSSLEAPPLRVPGLDDAAARRLELVGVRLSLGLQSRVRDGDPRCSSHRVDELPVGQQPFVVEQDRNLLSVVLDRRHRPPRASRRQLDRVAGVVDVRLGIRQAIADDERRIAERASELAAKGRGLLRRAEVDDESGDDRLRPAGTEQIDRRERSPRARSRGVHPEDRVVASEPASRPTAPTASTAANATAAPSARLAALRAGPVALREHLRSEAPRPRRSARA